MDETELGGLKAPLPAAKGRLYLDNKIILTVRSIIMPFVKLQKLIKFWISLKFLRCHRGTMSCSGTLAFLEPTDQFPEVYVNSDMANRTSGCQLSYLPRPRYLLICDDFFPNVPRFLTCSFWIPASVVHIIQEFQLSSLNESWRNIRFNNLRLNERIFELLT